MSNIKQAYPGEPVKIDIIATRDDTFQFSFRGWTRDGQPYDFTGHTFHMQVKEKREEGAAVILDITDADFTISQDAVGSAASVQNVVSVTHDASNMDIEPKDYVYDIEMADAEGTLQTIIREDCYFRVEQDVTTPPDGGTTT